MKLFALAAVGVGGLVLATGGTVAAYTLAAQADVTVTAIVKNHPDGGHGTPELWARDSFTIKVTISETTPGHFKLSTVDHGSFTTVQCAKCSPNAGVAIARKVTGAFDGTETGAAVGTLKSPTEIAKLNGKTIDDTTAADKASSKFKSEQWFQQFFLPGVTGSPSSAGYAFTYKTADELWTDASTNNDGCTPRKGCPGTAGSPAAGDITGKLSSKLTVVHVCRVSKTDARYRWTVKNVQGDRAVKFTDRVSYHGKWSKVSTGTVSAGGSTTITTPTGGYISIRYYNGYGVPERTSARPKPHVYC